MWRIVLLANFAGTLFGTLFWAFAPGLSPGLEGAMLEVSRRIHRLRMAPCFRLSGLGRSKGAVLLRQNQRLPHR